MSKKRKRSYCTWCLERGEWDIIEIDGHYARFCPACKKKHEAAVANRIQESPDVPDDIEDLAF